MVELIVTEKPSSAAKVAQALADGKPVQKKSKQATYFEITHNGKDIIVTSAVGHLYGLVEENKKSWAYPVFDVKWEASYKSGKELAYVKDYIDNIEALAKKATEFTIACDYDVEGEVIGYNVVRFACKKKDANRMKFSTLTKPDLVEAYEQKVKHLDWGQAYAGETRHKLDWFYGINLSRALTASVKAAGSFKVMSVGRVQGPALKLLVDREREIQAFVPVPFWLIQLLGDFKKTDIEAFHEGDKIFDKNEVERILKTIKGAKQALVQSVKRTQRQHAPPHPFDLTTLQSESYGQFKITPKETLDIAQNLYLAGVTSYPRTSSQQLDPKLGFTKIMQDLAKQGEYKDLCAQLLKEKSLIPNNGPKTDPAHPAIYPTGVAPKSLNPRQQKVYDLIVKRFMATFAKPALRETMEVLLDVNKEIFVTRGTRTLKEEWYVFYKPYVRAEDTILPDMKEGDHVTIKELNQIDKETQPPSRFNQSSIIKELEKRNLGTKATRADILERLFQRGYIEGVQITVSQLGMETTRLLENHAPAIVDEQLTAEFEEDMDKIREEKKTPDQILERAKTFLTKLLGDFKKKEKVIGQEILVSIRETQDTQNFMGTCQKCKEGKLMVRRGKFGRFVACDKYPDCSTTFAIPKMGPIKATGKECEKCQNPIIEVGKGRTRRVTCINPDCVSRGAAVQVDAKSGKKYPEEGMKCPTCGDGEMILRKSFFGEFLGCNKYPKCKTLMNIKDGKVNVDKVVVKTGDTPKKAAAKKVSKEVARELEANVTVEGKVKKTAVKKTVPKKTVKK